MSGIPSSRIQAQRFSAIYFHRFRLSIDKNHLILNDFIDFDFYPLTTRGRTGPPGCNCTRIYTPTLFWKGGRSEKLDAYNGLTNISHQKKILNLVLKERFLYKW